MQYLVAVLFLVGTVGVMPLGAQQSKQRTSEDEVLIIKGSDNPNLIPVWKRWETVLRILQGQRPEASVLGVTEPERSMVLREADALAKLYVDLAKESKPLVDEMKKQGTDPWDIRDALFNDLTLKHRWAIIDARGRILDQLTPESTANFEVNWTQKVIQGITIRLRGPIIDRFYVPF